MVQHVSSGIPLIIRSSKLYLQPLVYIPMRWAAIVQAGWELETCWAFIDFGIINSVKRLHLVGLFYYKVASCWSILLQGCILLVYSITRLHLVGHERVELYWFSSVFTLQASINIYPCEFPFRLLGPAVSAFFFNLVV